MKDEEIRSVANGIKAASGANFKAILIGLLEELKQNGVINSYEDNVHIAHDEYPYPTAYKASYVITTNEDSKIVVSATNSYRSGRAKSSFHNLLGFKQNSEYKDSTVAYVFLVNEPDDVFNEFKARVRSGTQHCTATHLYSLDDFIEFLVEHTYEAFQLIEEDYGEEEVASPRVMFSESESTVVEDGSYYGKTGNQREREIVAELNSVRNLTDHINGSDTVNPIFAIVVDRILEDKGLNISDIHKIHATNSVPKLASGGNAKTDLIVMLVDNTSQSHQATVSVKNTKANRVSCHDYRVEDYIRVLSCAGTRLEYYLIMFQEHGSKKGMESSFIEGDSLDEFERLLSDKRKTLMEWGLTGQHDSQNLIDPLTQVSEYLLTFKNEVIGFYSMPEYIALLDSYKGTLDKPFGWTHPSKQRGKRIQLKVPIL